MEDQLLDYQDTVKDLENAPSVSVALPNSQEGEVYRNMERVVDQVETADRIEGKEFQFKICTRCGEEAVNDMDCPACGGKKFKLTQRLKKNRTDEIMNRQTYFKCRTCGKRYKEPTDCCIANYEATEVKKDGWNEGFYCLGCQKIYAYKVDCCPEGLIAGTYKLDPTGTLRQLLGA